MATSTSSASGSAPSASEEDRCAWCSKLCRPRRCTRCYSVSFCSRECQRADWHADENGHRKTCDALYSARTGSTISDSAVAGAGAAAASTAAVAASNNVRNAPAPDVVAATEAELRELLSGRLAKMSLNQVQEEYYKTKDVIKDMEASMSKTDSSLETPLTPAPIQKEAFSVKKEPSKSKIGSLVRPARTVQTKGEAAAPASIFDSIGQDWQCLVERLPHVSCYSITLTPRAREKKILRRLNAKQNETTPLADRLRMKIAQAKNSKSKTSVTVFEAGLANGTNEEEIIVILTLPSAILPDAPGIRISDDTDGSISVRLPYTHGDAQKSDWACVDDGEEIIAAAASPLSDPEDLTVISCRSCGHHLLANEAIISKVLPLPIGCWDEISDYLTCYEGQPALDFGPKAISANCGIVLDDGSVMVINQGDLGHNVCVLAIDGYGEAEENIEKNDGERPKDLTPPSTLADLDAMKNGAAFRGLRQWRDSVGGATLCCSHCCCTLGFATLENLDAYRLFKHRLSSLTRRRSTELTRDAFARNTVASFLAKDMVRYAESQAVFTFIITARPNTTEGVESIKWKGCILLKLISWDTVIATSSTKGKGIVNTPFSKGIKLIYECVDDIAEKDITSRSGSSSKAESIEDVMSWTWGGVDLCCPPGSDRSKHGQQQPADINVGETTLQNIPEYGQAAVQIFLTEDEISQVRDEVKANSLFFSESVSKATLLLKLGGVDGKDLSDDKGLSVIPIL